MEAKRRKSIEDMCACVHVCLCACVLVEFSKNERKTSRDESIRVKNGLNVIVSHSLSQSYLGVDTRLIVPMII